MKCSPCYMGAYVAKSLTAPASGAGYTRAARSTQLSAGVATGAAPTFNGHFAIHFGVSSFRVDGWG
jgi:hypothetical protein